jgi:hypothetical protein
MSDELLAAVDLGSNSFRLLIGKLDGDQIAPVSTWREGVRLAGGLDEKSVLSDAKIEEAVAALTRFRERLSAVARCKERERTIKAIGGRAWCIDRRDFGYRRGALDLSGLRALATLE